MTFLIGFLTVILVINCIFLVLLVLIQLPKKEAGIGMAFGGSATEALFGAGSGTVLTKATKYSAGLFMGLALVLSILNANVARKSGRMLDQELQKRASAIPALAPVRTSTIPASATPPALPLTTTNVATPPPAALGLTATNVAAAPPVAPEATNVPAAPAK